MFTSRVKVSKDEKKLKEERKKKKKRSHEKEDQPSTSLKPYDSTFNVQGVVKIILSSITQKAIGCVVGEDLTTDYPWIFIKKEKIEDNIELHEESSEFLPFKNRILEYPEEEILIGFDKPTEDDKLEFFFCSTKNAKDYVVETLEKQKKELHERLKQSVIKTPREWKSYGSETEVDDGIIKNFRPLIEVEVETTYPLYKEKKTFKLRLVEDAKDGYMELLPSRFPITNVYRKRIDATVQVSLPTVDNEAQTNPTYPKNTWTQYNYKYDEPTFDKQQNLNLVKFITKQSETINEIIHLNEHINLYSDDYQNIHKYFSPRLTVSNRDLISFRDVITCKSKLVTHVTLDPFHSGMLAAAYARWSFNLSITENKSQIDEVNATTFDDNFVLIWCNTDSLKPKLYLRAFREVSKLRHCPSRPDILIGGMKNGQIIIWDLKNRIEKVETRDILTATQLKHRLIMQHLSSWMKGSEGINVVQPTVISNLEESHKCAVTGIRFVMQDYKITRNGQVVKMEEGKQSLQMMTCALDGSILIWDLLTNPTDDDKAEPKAKKGRLKERPPALTTDISEFRGLHMKLSPMYKIFVKDKITQLPHPITCMNIRNQNFSFKARNPETTEDIFKRTYFDAVTSPDPYVFNNVIQVCNMLGYFFNATFEGHDFDQGQKINFEDIKYTDYQRVHDGPIGTCLNNKRDLNCILTIGGRVFAIWYINKLTKPIFWRKCHCRYVGGVWSSQQIGAIVLAREDTYVETWTLLTKTASPSKIVRMTGNPIIDYISDYRRKHVKKGTIATTDIFGAVRIYRIPKVGQIDKPEMYNALSDILLSRIFERKQGLATWLAKWKILHGYQKSGKSEENLQKEVKKSIIEPTKVEERKKPIEEKSKRIKWQEKQEKIMYDSLLEKKKLNLEEIERHKIPLREMIQLQKQKEEEVQKKIEIKEEIFEGAKKKVFRAPEIKKKMKYRVDISEDFRKQLKEQYKESYESQIQQTLKFVEENKYEHRFQWGALISEGKERRKTMSQYFGGSELRRERSSLKKNITFGFKKTNPVEHKEHE